MSPALQAIVDWLRTGGRMAHLDYGALPDALCHIAQRAGDADEADPAALARATDAVRAHLEAVVMEHDPEALALLLDGVLPLARSAGYDPPRLLVAMGLLTHDEILADLAEMRRGIPPPPA